MKAAKVTYIDLGYSSAREWWEEIGLPAYNRFLITPCRQTAVDACIHAWHVNEWLWHELHPGSDNRNDQSYSAWKKALLKECKELDWVKDIANAAKHRGLGDKTAVKTLQEKGFHAFTIGGTILTVGGRAIGVTLPLSIQLDDGSTETISRALEKVVAHWNRLLGVTGED